MKNITVAVYEKLCANVTNTVEKAFYKSVFLQNSNYLENALYGVIIDLADAPCYKSYGDKEAEDAVKRCYCALPAAYRKNTFAVIRARRYNIKTAKAPSYCCENGAYGALKGLLYGILECTLILGELPKDPKIIYFSASNGIIEAGGINALIKEGMCREKNVFPFIKTAKKCSFSVFEGLYFKDNFFNTEKSVITHSTKRIYTKYGNLLLKNIYVYNMPEIQKKRNILNFEKKVNFSRSAFRSAIAASRIFMKMKEKSEFFINSPEDALFSLNAYVAMYAFGFLGEKEVTLNSEELMDIFEEMLSENFEIIHKSHIILLITSLISVYSRLAVSISEFWVLKLRLEKIYSILNDDNSKFIDKNENIYLIMCYKNAIPDLNKKYYMPILLKIMLEENEKNLFQHVNFNDIFSCFIVLVRAVNLCFSDNFRSFLFDFPVFAAKSSFLARIIDQESEKLYNDVEKNNMVKKYDVYFHTLKKSGLDPVKERFFKCGEDIILLPYAAYLEEIVKKSPMYGKNKIVKICYISDVLSPILCKIIKSASVVSGVSINIILSNKYFTNKAKSKFFGKAEFFSAENKELCENIIKDSYYVQKITYQTSLLSLMENARCRFKFSANIKCVPEIFSHKLLGGGDLKNGFCTFMPDGENISYGEFIENAFTQINLVKTAFVPKMRIKLIKLEFNDPKYRNGTTFSVLLENGEILSAENSKELKNGDKITVFKHDTGNAIVYAIQIYKNEKECRWFKKKIEETGFFEKCILSVENENKVYALHLKILEPFIENTDFFNSIKKQLPISFFGKIIKLLDYGELKGEKLAMAVKQYTELTGDKNILNIRLSAYYTKGDKKLKKDKDDYRYPFYIHCLDRIKSFKDGS